MGECFGWKNPKTFNKLENPYRKPPFYVPFLVLETPDTESVRAVRAIHRVHLRGRHDQTIAVGGIRRRGPVVPVHTLIIVRGSRTVTVPGETELERGDDRSVSLSCARTDNGRINGRCRVAPFPNGRYVVAVRARSLHERLVRCGLAREYTGGRCSGRTSPEVVVLRGDPVVGRSTVLDEVGMTDGTCGGSGEGERRGRGGLGRDIVVASPLVISSDGVTVREVAIVRGTATIREGRA